MVKVTVAGGSNGLGRVIVRTIAATGKHEVSVLSRQHKETDPRDSILVLAADYSNPESIADVLRSNGTEVVISTIGILFEDTRRAQMNLIEGAEKSGTVKRFAPSEFAYEYLAAAEAGYPCQLPGLEGYKGNTYKIEAVKRLRSTSMESTRFMIGFLMDYYGAPAELPPVLPLAVVLDMENNKAALPVTGDDKVTLTHSETIGKFVAASLDLKEWPEKSWIIGDTLTWREALGFVESTRKIKFEVHFDSIDNLKESKITELPANVSKYELVGKPFIDGMMSLWSLGFAWGWYDLTSYKKSEKTLNELFPELETLTFKNFILRCFGQGAK
ncbi:NmrA domain-containing protein [Fusarium sp. LHS14.1]|nr:NmrA domain-containing protein [Fusarium sp. LHS14.1]